MKKTPAQSRVFLLLLILCLAFATLPGCSGGGGGSTSKGTSPTPTPTSSSFTVSDIQNAITSQGANWNAGATEQVLLPETQQKCLCGVRALPQFRAKDRVASKAERSLPQQYSRNAFFSGTNWMTAVKDQGMFRTSVSYAITGALESRMKVIQCYSQGKPNLSGWYLFNKGGGNANDGMDVVSALNTMRDNGCVAEEFCPLPQTNVFSCNDANLGRYKIMGWYAKTKDPSSIKQAIMDDGPVVATMTVYRDFYAYVGGIYRHVTGEEMGFHAVSIVGWDDTNHCWICKNSWGTTWGEGGNFRIEYGQCGIEENAVSLEPAIDPILNKIYPESATSGSSVAISGSFLGGSQSSSTIEFNGVSVTNVTSWTPEQIICEVPSGAQSGGVKVTINGQASNVLNFTVQATAPSTITGRVTDSATGSGIANASVSAGTQSVSTNSSGYYTISPVPTGSQTVMASSSGYLSGSKPVTVVSGSTITANISLAPITNGTITGQVTFAGSGLDNITVAAGGRSAVTASGGYFILTNVPTGIQTVTATASGYQNNSTTVNVSAGGTVPANINLQMPTPAPTPTPTPTLTPSPAPTPTPIIRVSVIAGGADHTVALKSDGTVWAWGYNVHGQLGDGTTANRHSPVQVPGLTGVSAVATGGWHTVALKNNGTVWAWGYNANGQVADGTTSDRHSPVQVPSLSGVSAIVSEEDTILALKNDGTVWAWGRNDFGQLGDGTTSDRHSPVQVPGLSGVSAISGGGFHTLALKNDGTLWAWGYNVYGQLGDGTTTNRLSPVQVPGFTDVSSIACGSYHTLALKNDGTLWAWGYNIYGQLGDGTTIDRYFPVQISGLSRVSFGEYVGGLHTVVLKNDGTFWAWGRNSYGQLGDGTTIDKYSPVQVPGLTGVSAVGGAYGYTLASKNDGTVWAWGYNGNGQLGDGTTTNRNIPVQVIFH